MTSHLRLAAHLSLGLALALGGAAGCKKSGEPVEVVQGKKPPIVKAKKPGGDAKAKPGDAAKAPIAPDAGGQHPLPKPVAVAQAPTPTAAPGSSAAAAAAPVVPVPAPLHGKLPLAAAKPEPAKPEPAKPEPAKPEVAKVEPPAPAFKAPEPPPPVGAVTVRATPAEAPLDVNGHIIAADLPKVLGTKQKFHRTELVGITPTPAYNAMFYATDKPDQFGVSVQVWHDPNLAESRTRFNTMKNSYSNVTPTNKVTDMGFRSFYASVVTLVFVDPRRPLLAAVSCSAKVCTGDQMIELARRVAERLH